MTLCYELETLEVLVRENLHPKNFLRAKSLTKKEFDQLNDLLLKEKETVKRRLKKVAYSYPKENHRKLYIQQHQFAVTNLKNVVVDFILPKGVNDLVETEGERYEAKLYKRCLTILRDLFCFIREEFPQYFNHDEKVSIVTILNLHESLRPRIIKIRKRLLKDGYDADLVEMVVHSIQSFCNMKNSTRLTYRKLSYLKSLIDDLEDLKEKAFPVSQYPLLIIFLVYMDFNLPVFKNYFVKFIHAEINKCETIAEKIETISFHHKEICQLQVKPCVSLTPEAPSVQLDIVTWLFNEMSHLEKKQSLGLVAPIHFKEVGDPENEKGIYSQFTVEELGLFFKIQKETDLLKNKSMKQVARNVADNWHSKQKLNISWQYLYNSMSNSDTGTIRNLEDKLIGMVNWLRKMRGRM
jgi:hypothetical protein